MARRAAISSTLGSTLEWIDFTAYGAVAATVLPTQFFPTMDPSTAILASFATFGVGFVVRPAGGVSLGFEEGEHGVRVNAICPGITRTPFHINRHGTAKVDELVPPYVLQRWADPKELAYPMLWLASDEASYVTAATFMIDGGLPS
jgi:hypothetical protein